MQVRGQPTLMETNKEFLGEEVSRWIRHCSREFTAQTLKDLQGGRSTFLMQRYKRDWTPAVDAGGGNSPFSLISQLVSKTCWELWLYLLQNIKTKSVHLPLIAAVLTLRSFAFFFKPLNLIIYLHSSKCFLKTFCRTADTKGPASWKRFDEKDFLTGLSWNQSWNF